MSGTMIVKLYLPKYWPQEMYEAWLAWITAAIAEAKTGEGSEGTLMLRHVEHFEIEIND
jgi:hypothetical protein